MSIEHLKQSDETFVGVYGGAFDPPHMGHLIVPGLIFGRSKARHIFVIPSYAHPFAKRMTPFDARVAMCNAAFKAYGDSVTVSPIEKEIATENQPVYTIDLLNHLSRRNPKTRIRLIIGADAYASRGQWKAFEEIEEQYSPLIVPRFGHEATHATEGIPSPPNIASRDFRSNPSSLELRGMIPKNVLEMIEERSLYKKDSNP